MDHCFLPICPLVQIGTAPLSLPVPSATCPDPILPWWNLWAFCGPQTTLLAMDALTKALLNPTDEIIWKQTGFFEQVDSLERRSPTLPPKPFPTCSTSLSADPVVSELTAQPCAPLPRSTHTFLTGLPLFHSTNPLSLRILGTLFLLAECLHQGRKAWKSNRKNKRLVLGDGVGLENLCKMSLCALVGRISYKALSPPPLEDWVKTEWTPIIGYCPEVLYLKKGWLGFLCRTPEDATLLLSSSWVFGGSSLMLKRWRLAFNPDTDYFQYRHLWVLLPGLPLHFWTKEAIRAIGDTLGRFISFDSGSLSGSSRKMGKVLVEIDITAGLPENLEIVWRGRKSLQPLDYLGIPFRCNSVEKLDISAETVQVRQGLSLLKKQTCT
jgi:hypothetical protein